MESSKLIDVLLNKEFNCELQNKTTIILEQYKLYVQMADKISERRQSANSFFLSLSTTLVAAIGYLIISHASSQYAYLFSLLPLIGAAISFVWYRLLRSYRDLNAGKYLVIHALEQQLPVKPYDAEWKAVGEGKDKKLYLPFSHIELVLPWLFLFGHLVIFVFFVPLV